MIHVHASRVHNDGSLEEIYAESHRNVADAADWIRDLLGCARSGEAYDLTVEVEHADPPRLRPVS